MVQREGRIIRKGNENKKVKIYRYICKGSFDSYSWQILETKQRFISEFFIGTTNQREASDLEENVLTYAQVKALAISDPRMKQMAEKENELRRIRILSTEFSSDLKKRKEDIKKKQEDIIDMQLKLKRTINNKEYFNSIPPKSLKDEYARIKEVFTKEFINGLNSQEESFLEFKIRVPKIQNTKKPHIMLERLGVEYSVIVGDSTIGNRRRIINCLEGLDKICVKYEEQIETLKGSIVQNERILDNENPYFPQIEVLENEVVTLKNQIINKEAS